MRHFSRVYPIKAIEEVAVYGGQGRELFKLL
jgi:hypothetical protein